MKRGIFLFILLCQCFLSAFSQQGDYHPGKLFVKVEPASTIELPQFHAVPPAAIHEVEGLSALVNAYGIQTIKKPFRTPDPRLQCIYEFHFSAKDRVESLITELQKLPWVGYAEKVPIDRMDVTPNDLNFLQWSLTRINAQAAWDISTGSTDVVVAIVDNAVRITHADLAANVWVNPGEIDGNLIDDDNNGYVDDINGYDVANDDPDPMPPAGAGFDHGSHVAGITSAVTDNGTGIASIGWSVKLMCIKTKFDSTTGAELDNTYGGVDYAIAAGADVVNMSYGGMGFSSTYSSLFQVGYDSGLVFVASAGNDGLFVQRFPAAYAHVISVGSTDLNDTKSGFSNYHPSVDVMAPGNGIYSCMGDGNNSYDFMGGTSMSAPLAAGLCALILSVNDTLSTDAVEACLEYGCENIDALNASYAGNLGAGRINALNSLVCAQNPSVTEIETQSFVLITPFPNPANDLLWVEARFPVGADVKATLRDMRGVIRADLFQGIALAPVVRIPVSCDDLESGIYFIEWKSGTKQQVQRVAVIH
jgi:serine protease